MRNLKLTRNVLVLAAAALLTAALGSAIAAITVYENSFSSRAEFKEIIKSGGGKRATSYREKGKAMRAARQAQPDHLLLPAPGPGRHRAAQPRCDDRRQDAQEDAEGRCAAAPSSRSRCAPEAAGSATRCASSRQASASSCCAGRPAATSRSRGKNNAIKRVNKRNRLRLVAAARRSRPASTARRSRGSTTPNPGQVSGRKVRFAVGSRKEKQGSVVRDLQERRGLGTRPVGPAGGVTRGETDLHRDARATEDGRPGGAWRATGR